MVNHIFNNKRKTDKSQSVFLIAEISSNHERNFNRAVELIKRAKKAGFDAVKFQAFTPESITIDAKNRYFRLKHSKSGCKTLYELYEKACTPLEWFKKLKRISNDLGLIFFATAFDKKAVDFLEELHVPIHKIASFELVDLPLIKYVAMTQKPLILSTGMATISEIKDAVNTARNSGAKKIILLKCTSCYPAKPDEMNLKTIPHMNEIFNCPVGLSDHTEGISASIVAVSLGAVVIEKHITLTRKINTPDSYFSLEPQEFKGLVENIRIAENALGKIHYGATKKEGISRNYRRSLFVVNNIKKGEKITKKNIRSVRPANGIKPKYLEKVIGCKAKKNLKVGKPLKWDAISKS